MNAPGYTEAEQWSPNCHARGGTKVTNFLLHTQEGDGTAQSLATYLCNPGSQVSYHYTVDDQGNVRDVVDTDLCSWSVLDANPYTINLCFAGSYAAWTRAQWLANMSHGIEIAAWLAVQDCKKDGIPTTVIAPPYKRGAGISDHRYVTKVLGIGTHTDVGDGFPWDVFAGHVARFASPTPGGTVTTPAPNTLPSLVDGKSYTRDQYVQFSDYHAWRIDKMLTTLCQKQGLPYTDDALKQVK